MSTNSIFPIAAIGIATVDNDGNFLDASYTDIYPEVLKEHAFFSFLNEEKFDGQKAIVIDGKYSKNCISIRTMILSLHQIKNT